MTAIYQASCVDDPVGDPRELDPAGNDEHPDGACRRGHRGLWRQRRRDGTRRDAQCPMGRMGDAWDVAYGALFLASDEARYITGTELVVDGGAHRQLRLKVARLPRRMVARGGTSACGGRSEVGEEGPHLTHSAMARVLPSAEAREGRGRAANRFASAQDIEFVAYSWYCVKLNLCNPGNVQADFDFSLLPPSARSIASLLGLTKRRLTF